MGINSRATGVVGGCRGKASRTSDGARVMGVNIRATGVVGGYRGKGVGRPDKSAAMASGRTRPMANNIRATRDGQRCLVWSARKREQGKSVMYETAPPPDKRVPRASSHPPQDCSREKYPYRK